VTDRIEKLESALRAEDALITEAQRLLTNYLSKQTEPADLINNLLWLFDGPQQREAQKLAAEALGETGDHSSGCAPLALDRVTGL
jgi:hypothetical protein